MTTFVTSTYIGETCAAQVVCRDGFTASLYFSTTEGSNVGIVGLPQHVAEATAAAFNAAMAQPAPAPAQVAAE